MAHAESIGSEPRGEEAQNKQQGLLFWLFLWGHKLSVGTLGGIEAAIVLTLIFLK